MYYSVGIIEPIGGHGGNDVYLFNILKSISGQANFEAVLYTCDETSADGLENVNLIYSNIYGKKNKYVRGLNYVIGTVKALNDAKSKKMSIIHLHLFGFSFLEYINLYLSKKIYGFPVVCTIHDIESFVEYGKKYNVKHKYERFLKLMNAAIVHTDYARSELLKRMKNRERYENKINTIYACDIEYGILKKGTKNKVSARNIINLPLNRKVVLFFGMIKKVKGLDVLLKALVKVRERYSDVLLVVAGKVWKDDFNEYEGIIREKCLMPNVECRIKYISGEQVPFYFYSADIIVLPYKKIYNSGVLIRALSYGTPVLSSDFGPFKEFIKDDHNGYLFKTGDDESLADKLKLILDNQESLREVSVNGKRFIEENFSLQSIGCKYIEIYKDVLKIK